MSVEAPAGTEAFAEIQEKDIEMSALGEAEASVSTSHWHNILFTYFLEFQLLKKTLEAVAVSTMIGGIPLSVIANVIVIKKSRIFKRSCFKGFKRNFFS